MESDTDEFEMSALDDETYESYRVNCPDCAQPIALLPLEESLPEHALCASPWDPFGLTVCKGSGRAVSETATVEGEGAARERVVSELLSLPKGLDWRTQPFSHASGPGAQPQQAQDPAQERVGAQRR
ncbi:hypothetical protein NMN56_005115 [Streptomyces iconiensis]|uniref:Uncharacterized protein n=2 Tax=Streptomyces iconiensis TaxID=1384038 RepID=A0ABT6ZQL3_9ACTN|nr:hypothetical protein [Streptomyces iconiensis]MDJ1131343.1 hypothetical protein [Streptomyces iconiensis]